ncbi:MAG TPA: protein kinase [Thermoanaerobaculia bacterium]|jgi:Tol biopolymer transport system component|nr:protein kinase [Thermoanaerobaculia bacterium]
MSSKPRRPSGSDGEQKVMTPSAPAMPPTQADRPGITSQATPPPSADGGILHVGAIIAERYELVRFIAQGGMGEVYEAFDRDLGAPVALKFLTTALAADPMALERFKREVQLARSVRHPNVCRLFDLGRHRLADGRDLPFLSLEYLPGESLSRHLRREGPLSLPLAGRLARDIGAALAAAHSEGVVHRDLKPSNVLLVPTGPGDEALRAVVTDFGVARRIGAPPQEPHQPGSSSETLTTAGTLVGTLAYMAPEQLQGKDTTRRTDVYAFGVVLYEMVTAHQPHPSDGTLTGALSRFTDAPPPPRRLRADLPARWEQVILRCLQVRPEDRFADAGAVVAALHRRDRRPLMAAALLLLAVAAALGVRLWLARPPPAAAERAPVASAATTGGPQLTPVQVTTDPGIELDPAFSPDGNVLAYAADRTGSFEIYLRQLTAGGAELQLTRDGERNFQPAWSADGARLAYHSDGRHGIWLVPALGGTPRRLTDFGARPAWSPDGRQIVFQSDAAPHLPNAIAAMPPSTLWIVEPDGGSPRQLTRQDTPPGGHGAPSWSPDGRRVVFTASDRLDSHGWVLTLATSKLMPLTHQGGSIFYPAFSADGGTVLYSSTSSGVIGTMGDQTYPLWAVSLPADEGEQPGTPRAVAALGLASMRQLAVPPHGGKLAYSAVVSTTDLVALPLVASSGLPAGPPRQLGGSGGRESRPAFSPDGELLAFERWRAGTQSDLWTIDRHGGHPTQLTVDPAFDSQANWLPGGQSLLFLSGREGGKGLWRIDAAGGPQLRVGTFSEQPDWVRVSPEGGRLAYHRRRGGTTNVWVRDLTSAAERQLTDDQEFLGFPLWTPDGKTLIGERNRGESTYVVSLPAGGGAVEQLTATRGQAWPYSVSPDGDKVAFAGFRDGVWNVWWVSRRTREEHQLTHFSDTNSYVRYPAWSPRGDQLVFVQSRTSGDLWLLPGFQ